MLSSLRMRATTITVDAGLAERIERLSQERATTFESLANEALREGLEHLAAERGPEKKSGGLSYTQPVSLGGCLLESLDDVAGALAAPTRD